MAAVLQLPSGAVAALARERPTARFAAFDDAHMGTRRLRRRVHGLRPAVHACPPATPLPCVRLRVL
eukprot:5820142-Prymnesium_polylepis.1